MSVGMILVWILVATAIVLLLIMKWKINPTIALCVGALGLGIACNIGLATTAATIGSGFGNLMTSLGLPIGFGIILGELLSECGGCRVIAQTMLKGVGPKMAIWACALSGFILSVPVFFDVAFIILCPLCVEIAREIKKPMPYVIGPMAAGAMCAHHLVPPTPTPMLVPDYFDVSLGEMVLYGALIGAVVVWMSLRPDTVGIHFFLSVVLVAVAAVRLSTRLGLPSLLVYLALGIALGPLGQPPGLGEELVEDLVGHVLVAVGRLAHREVAAPALLALAADDGEGDHHPVADLQLLVVVPDLDDLAHELVAEDVALAHGRDVAVVQVQV